MTEIHELTLAETSDLVGRRQLSPVDLCSNYLERIDRLDSLLGCFTAVIAEQALSQARQAEAEIQAGKWRGPLHGIPIGIKDIIDVGGVATTCNSRIMKDYIADEDADVVARLKDAGAIIIGKQYTSEFAIGGGTPDAPFPTARNPWNREHTAGISSGGSAAAVAAGFCAGAIGSDTAGSIRVPAGYCGVVGMKPTHGLVSLRGIFPLSHSCDSCGPIAKSSEDCSILLQCIATPSRGWPQDLGAISRNVAGLKVGVVRSFYDGPNGASDEAIALLDAAIDVLKSLGVLITEVILPDLMDFNACGRAIILPEAFAIHRTQLLTDAALYGQFTRERLRLGAFVSAERYHQAQRFRRTLRDRVLEAMNGVDFLMTANTYDSAERIDEVELFPYFGKPSLCVPFNLTGQPALSLSCGVGSHDLPHSFQLIGRPFDDAQVLGLGCAYEKAAFSAMAMRPRLG